MSDDLVSRLREPLSQLPGDDDALMERVVSDRDEAATALEEARAEIERQAEQALIKDHAIIEAAKLAKRLMTRAVAAESELSTIRARVREVVGRIVAIENKEYGGDYDEIEEAREIARQLMEEVK